MVKSRLILARLLFREWFAKADLERRPEPTALMNNLENVAAFHAQGEGQGPLLPVYHFNALAISSLVREGGVVVDLGSGSGQFLAYLARCRPDLRIMGIELADAMVEMGREALDSLGLASRVTIEPGDMTCFTEWLPERVDLISSVFSLHHLPNESQLLDCLAQIEQTRLRDRCSVWLFDHARPRCAKTAREFPDIFTPDAGEAFKRDSENSLIAAYAFNDLSGYLDDLSNAYSHRCSRWLRLYQVHWHKGEGQEGRGWRDPGLMQDWTDYKGLRALFPDVPPASD